MCDCLECQVLQELNIVSGSLAYYEGLYGNVPGHPTVYYMFPENDKKEIAYQQGRKAGLIFRYNEMRGYRYWR